jgi:hypothetical protein
MMMCSTATKSNWRQTSCGRDLAGWFPFPVSVSGVYFRFPFSVSRDVLCGGSLSLSSSLLLSTESPESSVADPDPGSPPPSPVYF